MHHSYVPASFIFSLAAPGSWPCLPGCRMLPSTCPSWPPCTRASSCPGANIPRHPGPPLPPSASYICCFFLSFFSQFVLNFQSPARSTCFKPNEYRHKMVYPKVVATLPLPGCLHAHGESRGASEGHLLHPTEDPDTLQSPGPGIRRPRPLRGPPWLSCSPSQGPTLPAPGSSTNTRYTTSLGCALFCILNPNINSFKTIKAKYK